MLFVVVVFPFLSPILFVSFFAFFFRHGGLPIFFLLLSNVASNLFEALILFYITLSYYTLHYSGFGTIGK